MCPQQMNRPVHASCFPFFFFQYIQLFFREDKVLSCVRFKCANKLSQALACASSVTEMWVFIVASGIQGSHSHPEMSKHTEHPHHGQSDTHLWPIMLHKPLHFHYYSLRLKSYALSEWCSASLLLDLVSLPARDPAGSFCQRSRTYYSWSNTEPKHCNLREVVNTS